MAFGLTGAARFADTAVGANRLPLRRRSGEFVDLRSCAAYVFPLSNSDISCADLMNILDRQPLFGYALRYFDARAAAR